MRALLLGLGLGVLMASAASAQFYESHFGKNKIQYERFDWHVLQTEHFDIYYYPEMQALAEHGAYFAEEAYRTLQQRFNYTLPRRTPIIFYAAPYHFQQTNTTPGFIPEGVGGFFELIKGRVVIPASGNLYRFRRVIWHELVHVFTFHRAFRVLRDHRVPPDRYLPLWFTEGLAEYWSGPPDDQHEMILRDALYANYLVPLENMYRIYGTFLMYKEGEALCRFIAETYGEEKLLELIEQFWIDRDFRRVMEHVLGEDFYTISDRWEQWLKERYLPELPRQTLPSLASEAIVARGFSAKPIVYRRRDGRRFVYYLGNEGAYTNLYALPVDSAYRPQGKPKTLIRTGRSERFESINLLEDRMDVSAEGVLAFTTRSGEGDVLHLYDLEREELVNTYRFPRLVALYSPTWSPDGTRLAFSAIDEGGWIDLYVLELDTERLERLTRDLYDDRDPAWSPDGRYLVFASDRTAWGDRYGMNLFLYDFHTGQLRQLTDGWRRDREPRWSPDGRYVVFASAVVETDGRFGPRDVWAVEVAPALPTRPVAAAYPETGSEPVGPPVRRLYRLTNLATAAFDPLWTPDGHLLFSAFEHYRFTVRRIPDVAERLVRPHQQTAVALLGSQPPWKPGRLSADSGVRRRPYRRRYSLDVAYGGISISQSALWGTTGGAALAFSDLLGDDRWYVTVFHTGRGSGELLKGLNVAVSRVQLHRRTDVGYGLYRFAGLRFDLTDPDAAAEYPLLWEELVGGYGALSYPISTFQRIELNTALAWSDKRVAIRGVRRRALLLSNALAFVHDDALYGANGPVEGWRANLTVGYTSDLRYSNVSYYTLSLDVRHYLRLMRNVTLASWGLLRMNEGREARLWFLGGSWDLRGFPLFDVRGRKLWFTSHELRFPILEAPSLYIPLLAPFGIANLRGALFFDAAHVWNDDYNERQPQLYAGETLGAIGLGFRLNLLGGLVLRYDIGYRYRDGFRHRERSFRQFFFGWDF
mgnify:FL=1